MTGNFPPLKSTIVSNQPGSTLTNPGFSLSTVSSKSLLGF